MAMEAGLDTGPMLLRKVCPIGADATGGSLHDELAQLGRDALLEALARLSEPGGLTAQPQDSDRATYADKLDKQEAWIDWSRPAEQIERQVRAFNPWPVAQTRLDGETLRIWRARVEAGAADQPPGQVLAADRDGIRVACGRGRLCLLELQAPGRKRVSAGEFLNARRLDGARLGQPG